MLSIGTAKSELPPGALLFYLHFAVHTTTDSTFQHSLCLTMPGELEVVSNYILHAHSVSVSSKLKLCVAAFMNKSIA